MKVIKCPYCGAEFLPSEIYLRDYFLGKANTVVRDDKNKIESYQGIEQDLEETFNCDFCDKKFKVNAYIEYKVKGIEFEEEYVSNLYEDRISLGE